MYNHEPLKSFWKASLIGIVLTTTWRDDEADRGAFCAGTLAEELEDVPGVGSPFEVD